MTSSAMRLWMDAASAAGPFTNTGCSTQDSSGQTYNTEPAGISLGFGVAPWRGPVEKMVVVNSALSAADTRCIEEYLARTCDSTITPAAPASASATAGSGTATVGVAAPGWNQRRSRSDQDHERDHPVLAHRPSGVPSRCRTVGIRCRRW